MKVHHLSKLSIHHSESLDDKYTVAEKDFPPNLREHASYAGRPIQWIANFGYQHKASGAAAGARLEEAYDVELDAHQRPEARLVYFDGIAVQPLATRPSDTAPGKLKATLDLGDPPIGWAG